MNAKTRNQIARESRGKPNPAVTANRVAHAEQAARTRASQNRHTLADMSMPSGTGPGPRRTRVSSHSKGQGEWNVSPYYSTHATVDARWSATVSKNRSV